MLLNCECSFQTVLVQQTGNVLELRFRKIVIQNTAITKASTVFAFVNFDYWFLCADVGMGGKS